MIAVIFEVLPNSQGQPGKLLSLSFWRDEQAVALWRNCEEHRQAQAVGRSGALADYRLRVATVMRDDGLTDREQAPPDSRHAYDDSH